MADVSDVDIDALPIACYEHIGQDALCAICYQPSEDNVSMCTQGHNACRSCADRMLVSGFGDKCPIGCPDLHRPGGQWVANRALNDVIKATPFKCPNAKSGCTHSSRLSELKTHFEDCEFKEVRCLVAACKWRGSRCHRHQHMQEVDHGRWLVDVMLFTQQAIVTADNSLDAVRTELNTLQQATRDKDEAIDRRLNSMYALFDNLHKTCQAIELKLGADDEDRPVRGSSKRKERRDEKTAKELESKEKDILALKMELNARPTQAQFNAIRDELFQLPSIVEWKTTQKQLETASLARDRFFRERDEARYDLEEMRERKRRLEESEASANKRL